MFRLERKTSDCLYFRWHDLCRVLTESSKKLQKLTDTFSKFAGLRPIYKNQLYFYILATYNWKLQLKNQYNLNSITNMKPLGINLIKCESPMSWNCMHERPVHDNCKHGWLNQALSQWRDILCSLLTDLILLRYEFSQNSSRCSM